MSYFCASLEKKRQGALSLKMPRYSLLTSPSLSKLLCKNVPQHIFPGISHLWKLQCVLHFGSFWHLNDAQFESAFELLYKKKLLCLPNLPPASMFCLPSCEACTWTKGKKNHIPRGSRFWTWKKKNFRLWFQFMWVTWNCQAFPCKDRDSNITPKAGELSRNKKK